MGKLIYSILRYQPSLISGEAINLGAIFYDPKSEYREFYNISKWHRVSAFDDTLNISLLKDLMLDIKDEIGTPITCGDFEIHKFCSQYNGDIYFDNCIELEEVDSINISDQIEEIKKMYFQFEYEVAVRPSIDEQKTFLGRLLKSNQIEYARNAKTTGNYGDSIKYDFIVGNYGIIFFNLNSKKIGDTTMNRVKAWAWNARENRDGLQLVILYNLEDETREDIKPALAILTDIPNSRLFNVYNGIWEIRDF